MTVRKFFGLWLGTALVSTVFAAAPAEFKVAGEWAVEVTVPASGNTTPVTAVLRVAPPEFVVVTDEKYDALPLFNPKVGGWLKGVQLRGVRAQETTTPSLIADTNIIVRSGTGAGAETWQAGVDYEFDLYWGTLGRTAKGRIADGKPVYVSYRHALLRLDAVILRADGRIELRRGEPKSAAPRPPEIMAGERHLGNLWLPGRPQKLAVEHLFPITEPVYPEPTKPSPTVAEKLLPATLKKLRAGEPLRVLAWGDSVTVGDYVPNPAREKWQQQFVARLRERFPGAKVELTTEAWGGRSTGSYLAEPPGSAHNYSEKVLGAKPDLVVSEFVNDAGLNPAQVEERYAKFLADFKSIGAEWIILTPHYVRPDWMGLNRERDIDNDPRPYVAGLRQFAARHEVALADAALRYGRLWRQGIPYSTIMLNSINHPDARGMKIFADALMELFL